MSTTNEREHDFLHHTLTVLTAINQFRSSYRLERLFIITESFRLLSTSISAHHCHHERAGLEWKERDGEFLIIAPQRALMDAISVQALS